MLNEMRYNGQDAMVLSTPARPINAADGGRYTVPEVHPTKSHSGRQFYKVQLSQLEIDRFWQFVEEADNGCWEWVGCVKSSGYGIFSLGRRGTAFRAHRVAWSILRGRLSDAQTLDHLCRNRRCVNPAHLDPVSNKENILRGESFSAKNARKTHCQRGHEFTPENISEYRGKRRCRACYQMRLVRDRKRVRPRKKVSDGV